MTIDRLPPRTVTLLGGAMLWLSACGGAAEQAPEAPAPTTPTGAAEPSATAEAPSPPPQPLTGYAGKYPFDEVEGVAWNDHPVVKAGIAAAVKDARARQAIETLEGPAAPIEMRGGKLLSWACEAHNCGPHQWAVHVDPANGATDVCYFDEAASATQSRWFLANGTEERRAGNCQ